MNKIDEILQPWQRFGVHLGLERMQRLLADLGDPHQSISVIHVAGSNGKGSVCAYLTSVLTAAGFRVGCYTSPHLISWQERITLDRAPIPEDELVQVLQQVQAAIPLTDSGLLNRAEVPTQFEVITAAAWVYFAQQNVDIAVIEVGLGGRLDATNVVDSPLVSVITSISLEHTQQLGDTLAKIAFEKAGIIKAKCPVVIGQLPSEAKAVFWEKVTSMESPTTWVEPATPLENGWVMAEGINYPLALLGEFQLMNSAVAIAAIQVLQNQGWQISLEAIQAGMEQTKWQGRVQWLEYQGKKLLIDGAHNPAAAIVLRQYVDQYVNQYVDNLTPKPVNWVMGILSTKDHRGIFRALLRPGDLLHLVPVPDHSSADPQELATLAQSICPELACCLVYGDVHQALEQSLPQPELTILCGSLYLVGYFLSPQTNSIPLGG